MIKIGQKVEFDPFKDIHVNGVANNGRRQVGTVIIVNASHQWFGVEYGDEDGTFRTSFRFDDIGDNVKIVG